MVRVTLPLPYPFAKQEKSVEVNAVLLEWLKQQNLKACPCSLVFIFMFAIDLSLSFTSNPNPYLPRLDLFLSFYPSSNDNPDQTLTLTLNLSFPNLYACCEVDNARSHCTGRDIAVTTFVKVCALVSRMG
jgi:hypothetical protein